MTNLHRAAYTDLPGDEELFPRLCGGDVEPRNLLSFYVFPYKLCREQAPDGKWKEVRIESDAYEEINPRDEVLQ